MASQYGGREGLISNFECDSAADLGCDSDIYLKRDSLISDAICQPRMRDSSDHLGRDSENCL